MKKIVIFGATGNIGAYLVDYCLNNIDLNEYEIVAVGRKDTDFFKKMSVEYVRVDMRNASDFEKLPKTSVYAIVNLAGLLPAYFEKNDPFAYVETNINGSLRIMEYARECGVDRIVYTQTWAEMAGYWGKRKKLSPSMPRKLLFTGDHAVYSITKCTVVDLMEYYKQQYGIKNFVFRLPNIYLYSPQKYYYVDGIKKAVAYRYIIDRACEGKDIELWGNPSAFKDIIYVKDLCQMIFLSLFAKRDGGTYNAGTGIKTTLKKQIEGIIEVFSPKNCQSIIVNKPEKPSFTSFVMDIKNAEKELGYKPKYDYISYLKDYKKESELKRFDELWLK